MKKNFHYRKPTSLSEDGLVTAYNMIPAGNDTLPDISGNGNSGVINGALSTLEGMSFDGINDFIMTTKFIQGQTPISYMERLKVKSFGIDKTIFSAGGYAAASKGILVATLNSGVIRIFVSSGSLGIVEGTSDPMPLNEWFTLAITWNGIANSDINIYIDGKYEETLNVNNDWTGTSSDEFQLRSFGNGVAGYLNSESELVSIYDKVITIKEITDFHNQFAKQYTIKESFINEPLDIPGTVPLDWDAGTGTFKVVQDTDNKVLECTTNGTISHYYNKDLYIDGGYFEIGYYNGLIWTDISTTIDDAISTYSWLSYLNNNLIYTFTVGQAIRQLLIKKGIET